MAVPAGVRVTVAALAIAVSACTGGGDDVIDEPVFPTETLENSSELPETSPTVGVDFGDDGPATDFLAALFMPRSSVSDAQVDCINDEMERSYPDGLPQAGTDEMDEALATIVEACDLLPG